MLYPVEIEVREQKVAAYHKAFGRTCGERCSLPKYTEYPVRALGRGDNTPRTVTSVERYRTPV